jgi:glycosyltransferase involved in cell wall biosynthesis
MKNINEKKPQKVALYDPYLDVMGGGERHILSMLQVFDTAGYDVSIFWDKNLNEHIQNHLNLSFSKPITFLPNIFKHGSVTQKLKELSQFDTFLYVTDGSYFFSSAQHNYVFCMVPQQSLYNMNVVNKLKTLNYTFICNSQYTQRWLQKWGVNATVVYPYIDNVFLESDTQAPREKTILVVGRFFKHLHSKRQDIAIHMFKKLKETYPEFNDFKLILAGNLKDEDKAYFEELQKIAVGDDSIIFQQNISFTQLLNYYRTSLFYWHCAGYEINEEEHPEQVEHLGITPLEAMASGCITLAYKAGGLKEIITEGENGFLFQSQKECIQKTAEIYNNVEKQKEIKKNAHEFVQKYFSYEAFKSNMIKIFQI